MKSIVVFKPGPIGDLLHSLPVAYALKDRYPESRLAFIVADEVRELAEGNPSIDCLISIPSHIYRGDPGGLFRLIKKIRELKPDFFIDLKSNVKSFIVRSLSGAPKVLFYRKERKKGEGHGRLHAVENLYQTILPLGVSPIPPMYRAHLKEEFVKKGETFIRERVSGKSTPVVVLNPTVGWGIPSRLWPPEYFSRLGDLLIEKTGAAVFITGAPSERQYCESIVQAMKREAHLAAGKLSLGETAGLIQCADVTVSGDTGPLHIAAAVGTSVIGLYGSVSVTRSRPWGDGHVVLKKDLPCVPCEEKVCPLGTMQCMKDITPEEVFEAVKTLIDRI